MNNQNAKSVYTILLPFVFLFMASESNTQIRVRRIFCSSFSSKVYGEDSIEKRNYLELNDGTKVYGEKIVWQTGIAVKDQIKIDNQKYKLNDVRGYFIGGRYSLRFGDNFARRIIHGKLSVYFLSREEIYYQDGRSKTRTVCGVWVKGNGAMQEIGTKEDIMDHVKDCPKAVEMMNKSYKDIRKAAKEEDDYLNQVFITYNNDCK